MSIPNPNFMRNVADTTAPSGGEVIDYIKLMLGIDTTGAQGGMEDLQRIMNQLGAGAEGSLGGIKGMLGNISKAAGLVGISLSGWAIASQALNMQQTLLDLEKGFYDVAREASRGGGAIQEWSQVYGNAAKNQYMEIASWARESLRRTDKEIGAVFASMARSGILSTKEMAGSSEEAIEKLSKFAKAAFVMEGVMGFNPQQIQTVFHSMAVNLQMDSDAIYESIAKFGQVQKLINLPLNEQVNIITTVLQQYSKFGVTLEDVALQMKNLTNETKAGTEELKNLGSTYDILQARLRGKAEVTPEQYAALWHMSTSDQIYKAFTTGLETPEQIDKRIGEVTKILKDSGMGERLGYSETQITNNEAAKLLMRKLGPTGIENTSDFDMGAFSKQLELGKVLNVGALSADVRQTISGPGGPEQVWLASKMPPAIPYPEEPQIRWRQQGDPTPFTTTAAENAKLATGSGVAAQLQQALESQAKKEGGTVLAADQYYDKSINSMHTIAEHTMGILKEVKFISDNVFRRILNPVDFFKGQQRAAGDVVEAELTEKISKGEKLPSLPSSVWGVLSGVGDYITSLGTDPSEFYQSAHKLSLITNLKAAGLVGVGEKVGKSARHRYDEIFGDEINEEDLSMLKKHKGNVPLGPGKALPLGAYLDYLGATLSNKEASEGFNAGESTISGLNQLRKWSDQGLKPPTKEKEETEETKTGTKKTSMAPKEQTGIAEFAVNTININVQGDQFPVTVSGAEQIIYRIDREKSQYGANA